MRRRLGGEQRVAQSVVAVDDGGGRRRRQVGGEPRADLLDGRESAGPVVLPQAGEAPQLTLEVAGGLAEALEAGSRPVDAVELDERVDELVGNPPALIETIQLRGHGIGDDRALHALHDIEGSANDRRVLARQKDPRRPHRGDFERPQQPRLAGDVVRARGERSAGRAAHDHLAPRAAHREGDVGMAVADGEHLDFGGVAVAEPVRREELDEGLDHEQGLARALGDVAAAADDVVRSQSLGHRLWQRTRPARRGSPRQA